MKKGILRILMVVMAVGFLFGLSILLYPLLANIWNNYREERLFEAYLENTANPPEGEDYSAEWEAAWNYNRGMEPVILPDSFVQARTPYTEDEAYASCLNVNGDGVMGYISIPKIEVTLPIYHSTEEEILEKGVGHLHGSSLPVGGEDTHTVLSAHRGLPGATLFTDLDQLQEGDQFYLYILDDVLAYEVDQILVIEPEDTEALQVEDGQDLATLLTCTPYGVNTHRLLVRGHRVPYDPEEEAEQGREVVHSVNTNYILWVTAGLSVTIVVIVIIPRAVRKKRENRRARDGENET